MPAWMRCAAWTWRAIRGAICSCATGGGEGGGICGCCGGRGGRPRGCARPGRAGRGCRCSPSGHSESISQPIRMMLADQRLSSTSRIERRPALSGWPSSRTTRMPAACLPSVCPLCGPLRAVRPVKYVAPAISVSRSHTGARLPPRLPWAPAPGATRSGSERDHADDHGIQQGRAHARPPFGEIWAWLGLVHEPNVHAYAGTAPWENGTRRGADRSSLGRRVRLALERGDEVLAGVQRLAVRDDHVLEVELEQLAQGGDRALARVAATPTRAARRRAPSARRRTRARAARAGRSASRPSRGRRRTPAARRAGRHRGGPNSSSVFGMSSRQYRTGPSARTPYQRTKRSTSRT